MIEEVTAMHVEEARQAARISHDKLLTAIRLDLPAEDQLRLMVQVVLCSSKLTELHSTYVEGKVAEMLQILSDYRYLVPQLRKLVQDRTENDHRS